MPQTGEYRCQGEYGGSTREIATADVPQAARDTAHKVWKYMDERFKRPENEAKGGQRRRLIYARIDGVMQDNAFILMEVEAIEPHLWLEAKTGNGALEKLWKIFCMK